MDRDRISAAIKSNFSSSSSFSIAQNIMDKSINNRKDYVIYNVIVRIQITSISTSRSQKREILTLSK